MVVAAAAGCATTENFTPAERATATSPGGEAAADYEMVVDGERLGDAMVWSNGAYRAENGRTVVHIGFRIENETDVPIEIEAEDLELRAEGGGRILQRDEPVAIEGPTSISPGRDGVLSVYFLMPDGVSPQEIDAIRLTWTARAADLAYSQRTPFLERPMEARYMPHPYYSPFYYSPFYDPFFYPVF
jgi:hypothetical protein